MNTLQTIAEWLAGEFDNQEQAIADPVWFVHLRLWHRPLPFRVEGNPAFLAEQANMLDPENPYRQRVLILQPPSATNSGDVGQVEYRAFRQPQQVKGAGAHPERLQTLSLEDLLPLPGCILRLSAAGQGFKTEPPPEAKCFFQYEGKTRQVVLGFEVEAQRFRSFDRGVDPETGKGLWGALMGPYQFTKRQSFNLGI
ncbi:MAG: chromophore lyase CpcT/CpeT [Cyanobacteria bacterium J06638_22]